MIVLLIAFALALLVLLSQLAVMIAGGVYSSYRSDWWWRLPLAILKLPYTLLRLWWNDLKDTWRLFSR